MRRVLDHNILICKQSEALDHELLKDNNCKVLMCVAEDGDVPKYSDIITIKWGMSDPLTGLADHNCIHEIVNLFDIAYRTALRLNGNICIYCISGHNRSAIIPAIWLIDHQYISLSDAAELTQVKDCKNWMKVLGYNFKE